MNHETKQALIGHIEPYVNTLDATNQVGAYVDIPMLNYQAYDFQSIIGLCCGRIIRKNRGNVNGTYTLSSTVRPGHYRITLQVQK
jgi:hypothetical protein